MDFPSNLLGACDSWSSCDPWDQTSAFILIGLGLISSLAFVVKLRLWGHTRYERVEQQGGSAVFSKTVLEMGYWIAQPIARALAYFRVSPHAISWAAALFALAAGILFAEGRFGLGALIGGVSAVFDAFDGMVARLSNRTTFGGKILDTTLDRYVEFFLIGGLTFYFRNQTLPFLLALGALVGSFMVSYSSAQLEIYQFKLRHNLMRRPERLACLILAAAITPFFESQVENWQVPYLKQWFHPLLFCLAWIALLANYSAAVRLYSLSKLRR